MKGEAIIGANVTLKGTTNGTITDFDGHFTLNVNDPNGILAVSFIGYKTKEVKIGEKTIFQIILEEDTETLDEVVVVGYGTCLLYTSPSPRDRQKSRMPSSA